MTYLRHIFQIFTLMMITTSGCLAQDTIYSRSVFFELGGSAGFASFNYEKQFFENTSLQLSWSAGLSAFPIDKNNGIVFVVPTVVHCYYGSDANKLEVGLGQGYSISTKASMFSLLTPLIGYRYQNPHRHWLYRVSYTPLVSYLFQWQYQNWVGLSIGYQW